MSAFPEVAAPPAACNPPSDAPVAQSSTEVRAARLAKFEREQLIVDYLNRGVSVAEIAARVGVAEKHMRAVIREIIVRRMPHPPEEFVAIQVSRLNEALLVAFSAMTGMNLKAVDRVVRIVRELDRYHGLVATERCRPETPPRIAVRGLEAPGESAMALGAELFCRAELAPQHVEEIARQSHANSSS
jgi:transposase-like protein